MRFGDDGRLYAINPEAGFFGVAPGTGHATNANAIAALNSNCIFTNVALTADGDVWWEGLTSDPPSGLTDWKGRPWSPQSGEPAAHPNARFTAPAGQCPSIAPEWEDPKGVPISAILFGGRRASAVPLVTESFNWRHGVFLASNVASEGTAAAEHKVGQLRRDPRFAMLPFCGYNMGDVLLRPLAEGGGRRGRVQTAQALFRELVFARTRTGGLSGPGYGDNSRVLEMSIFERLEGEGDAVETPIGRVPGLGALDVTGLGLTKAQMHLLLDVDVEVWREEAALIPPDYEKFGAQLPGGLWEEYEALLERLAASEMAAPAPGRYSLTFEVPCNTWSGYRSSSAARPVRAMAATSAD